MRRSPKSENQPLLDKESSAGSTNSSGNSGGVARQRSSPDGSEGVLTLDMAGGAGQGSIDIPRYPPGVGPAATSLTRAGLHDYPPPASYQRFLGRPLSLPASPPFEGGPVLHYQQDGSPDHSNHHNRDMPTGSYQPQQQPQQSPPLSGSQTVGGGGRLSPSPRTTAAGGRFARSQTVGSYTMPQHVLEVMGQGHSHTPARSHHRASIDLSSASAGPKTRGGGGGGGRPEPYIEEPLFDLDPDFDISAPHLMKMFNMLDRDKNGRLTYEELREGLLSMRGMHTIPPSKVNQIIRQIDKDESRDISQEEFVAAFQQLATKAMAMSHKGLGNRTHEIFCYDYGPEMATCRWVYSRLGQQPTGVFDTTATTHAPMPLDPALEEQQLEQSLDAFFREPINDVQPGNVRWISITGLEPAVVVRLANRYKLHPLQIEDVLTYDRERMKYAKTQKVHQVLVGRCLLAESTQGYPQLRKEQLSLFMLEEYSTVISIQKTPSEINSLLLARIMYAGSKIRLNGPRFLVYAIVDSIVDELFPILRLIRKKLKALHSDVTSQHRTSLESVHLIQHVIREANLLLLWLSPLSTVASRLQAELPQETDTELKKHLEDLVDHVHALKEQTSSMVGWAKSLADEALNEQQYRMNQVIYVLTMITTVVLPAQFLTGVFGMNFEYLPLLRSPQGFFIFWLLVGGAILFILCVFRWKNWL